MYNLVYNLYFRLHEYEMYSKSHRLDIGETELKSILLLQDCRAKKKNNKNDKKKKK